KEIAANYIPIRVDKDRRPEINARYNCGGWPTVAFLTPDRELIAGETFLTASELIPILERVAPFFREHRGEIQNRVEEMEEIRIRQQDRREVGPLGPDMINFVSHSILESFDAVHGGFGTGPKFPHAEAIDFALAEYVRHGDERLRNVVVRTLDAMVDGEIYDPVEGGFFRFSQGRDWHTPNTEKVLDSNAARVRFYLEAYQVFKKDSYKKQAAGTLNWLESRMLDSETGAFFGSQDAAPEYYGLPIELRRTRPAPRIERTLYADWNAMAASSLFLASVVFNEAKYSQMACRTLSFIMDEMFDERRGVYHYWDDTFRLPGLLSDQVYTLRALLDAASHTGDPRMLSRAARLAQVIRLRHLS
ncbi:MAG: thioredoxin domain-containing protein, partial [Spirochaetia bacterium]|nr:thioredoxin domain-containing protein [Spirochaetia bacterium]